MMLTDSIGGFQYICRSQSIYYKQHFVMKKNFNQNIFCKTHRTKLNNLKLLTICISLFLLNSCQNEECAERVNDESISITTKVPFDTIISEFNFSYQPQYNNYVTNSRNLPEKLTHLTLIKNNDTLNYNFNIKNSLSTSIYISTEPIDCDTIGGYSSWNKSSFFDTKSPTYYSCGFSVDVDCPQLNLFTQFLWKLIIYNLCQFWVCVILSFRFSSTEFVDF